MTNDASEAGRGLPPEILAIAQATRDTFGDGVRLKFAAWQGGSAGNPQWDDPGAQSPPIAPLLAPMATLR